MNYLALNQLLGKYQDLFPMIFQQQLHYSYLVR